MTEVKVKWNGHEAKVIPMTSDEGKFPIAGTSVLLKRGNYGLMCNWLDTEAGGCFDVIPVEKLEDGNIREMEPTNKEFVGGMDIWSQGYGLFSWRESQTRANVHVPEAKELSSFENPRDARRPKLVVFIPPERLDTDD